MIPILQEKARKQANGRKEERKKRKEGSNVGACALSQICSNHGGRASYGGFDGQNRCFQAKSPSAIPELPRLPSRPALWGWKSHAVILLLSRAIGLLSVSEGSGLLILPVCAIYHFTFALFGNCFPVPFALADVPHC